MEELLELKTLLTQANVSDVRSPYSQCFRFNRQINEKITY